MDSTENSGGTEVLTGETGKGAIPPKAELRRFHGSVHLDPLYVSHYAGLITEEVIQHMTKLVGAVVEITLEIQSKLRDCVSEKIVRDVTENCWTLKFESYGFEKE